MQCRKMTIFKTYVTFRLCSMFWGIPCRVCVNFQNYSFVLVHISLSSLSLHMIIFNLCLFFCFFSCIISQVNIRMLILLVRCMFCTSNANEKMSCGASTLGVLNQTFFTKCHDVVECDEKKRNPFSVYFSRFVWLSSSYFISRAKSQMRMSVVLCQTWHEVGNFNFVKQREIHFLSLYLPFRFWICCTEPIQQVANRKARDKSSIRIEMEKIKKNKQSESCAKKGALYCLLYRHVLSHWAGEFTAMEQKENVLNWRERFLFCFFAVWIGLCNIYFD